MKLSPKKAIHQFCKECIHDPMETGTWQQQVENCHITDCPLHEHRYISEKTRKLIREEEYSQMSLEERKKIDDKLEQSRKMIVLINENKKNKVHV